MFFATWCDRYEPRYRDYQFLLHQMHYNFYMCLTLVISKEKQKRDKRIARFPVLREL